MESFTLLPQLPGSAFGDGSHPTTRLCARAVDFLCRQRPFPSVLDVGTGTGILARTARKNGASFIVGTDIDSVALESARANAALDLSPVEILVSAAPPDHWGPRFDLVVSNILENVLVDLAPLISRALAPRGQLLLSGFTRLQVPRLQLAYDNQGLSRVSCSYLDDWALLHFLKE